MPNFKMLSENPNPAGGCLCSDMPTADTEGPFAVFFAHVEGTEANPHSVLCAGCARQVVDQLDDEDDE